MSKLVVLQTTKQPSISFLPSSLPAFNGTKLCQIKVLRTEKASKQGFNISGEKYVTFDGLARACAKVGGFPEIETVHYNPKEVDFGKEKAFPLRDEHFFASIEKAKHVLGWKPEFDVVEGLADSYNLDFGGETYRKEGFLN